MRRHSRLRFLVYANRQGVFTFRDADHWKSVACDVPIMIPDVLYFQMHLKHFYEEVREGAQYSNANFRTKLTLKI